MGLTIGLNGMVKGEAGDGLRVKGLNCREEG